MPVEEAFEFFDRPENLAKITPPRLGFTIHSSPSVVMAPGARIQYTIRWLGLPLRWTTLITAYEPPVRFIDEQEKGPYRYWQHTHAFRSVTGGTEMTDEVLYSLPLGWIGRIAHALVVRRQINKIFDYRARITEELFVPKAGEKRP